ncbi:glycoside hydrolase family 3 protein [Thermosipho ferrireducens]|uniref:beta-N-acetylhexosaminidase n=1 Tax=Thermosipho ferrireducens TaxID=2571116 RepID=A0ABX7S813_9BACT|nr:glycoside hydrolase family 3 N-terminal domain-containing protein [Thermosipho ferrireducens]QTA38734.1 glycoside hydrolase family 3 protein [Thermosipho ferrireducens]
MNREFGNLFFIGFQKEFNKQIVEKINPAGVILYPKNMEDIYKMQVNMERIYSLHDKGYRLFITSDHEGGQLETVPNIFPSPGNLALGKTGNVRSFGEYLGYMFKAHGFNMVFAPVVDVAYTYSSHVTGYRAFSFNYKVVEKQAKEFLLGLSKNKIAATLKHFPGHGKAKEDSHFTLPVVNDFEENDDDIEIFKSLAEDVDFIMTAHVLYPKVDDVIATLSKKFLTDILRKKFNYKGLVISDAFEMKALYKSYSEKEVIKKFFEAGGDIVLIGDIENHYHFFETFKTMVENGELDVELLKEKVKKVEKIKEKYVTKDYPTRFLSFAARDAIEHNLSAPVETPAFLIPQPKNLSLADTSEKDLKHLENIIREEFPESKVYREKEMEKMNFQDTVVYFVVDQIKKVKAKRVIYIFLRKFFDVENEYIIPYSSKLISIYHVLQLLKGEGSL